jgi:hypothetical protein
MTVQRCKTETLSWQQYLMEVMPLLTIIFVRIAYILEWFKTMKVMDMKLGVLFDYDKTQLLDNCYYE